MKTAIMCIIILTLVVSPGCTIQKQDSNELPTVVDSPVVGLWTDDSSGMPVTIDEQGFPVGEVFEGEWYGFRRNGTFFRLYYSSGVAVSGVLIQEGNFQTNQSSILLTSCTESFFRDLWDVQPEYYRQPIDNRTLMFRMDRLQGELVIYIKSPVRDAEQLYFKARE